VANKFKKLIGVFIVSFCIFWIIRNFYKAHILRQSFKITTGEVTRVGNVLRQGNMLSLSFKFSLHGQVFEGGGNYSLCGNLTIGEVSDSLLTKQVLVAYQPENPNNSLCIIRLDHAKQFKIEPTPLLLHYDSLITCK
jgi:hypothetical protein